MGNKNKQVNSKQNLWQKYQTRCLCFSSLKYCGCGWRSGCGSRNGCAL